ncbi:MAG: hypothetical protein ACD_21C00162G0006, partial [uncultured bacterium]
MSQDGECKPTWKCIYGVLKITSSSGAQ